MKFTNLEFYPSGFSLTREDNVQILFPYSKYECLTIDPHTRKMRLEIKKFGAFVRDYESSEKMHEDAKRILNRGKL